MHIYMCAEWSVTVLVYAYVYVEKYWNSQCLRSQQHVVLWPF